MANHVYSYVYTTSLVWLSVAMVTPKIAPAGESVADTLPLNVTQLMQNEGIIPDIIDAIGAVEVKVTFPSGATVRQGNQLTTGSVQIEPTVTWPSDPDAFYTLIMSDPDAPSRYLPVLRENFHWLVGNIQRGDVSTGDTMFAFRPSGPPWMTGSHRYVVLVFKQPTGRIEYGVKNESRWNRLGSSTRSFAQKYKLGHPIGGNFFLSKYGSDE